MAFFLSPLRSTAKIGKYLAIFFFDSFFLTLPPYFILFINKKVDLILKIKNINL